MSTDIKRHVSIRRRFAELFGGEPSVWTRAPGRVDLMGSHTDYNLGMVLTMPIEHDTWIAARPRADRTVRLHSMNLSATDAFSLADLLPSRDQPWSNYVRGVASELRAAGFKIEGFDAVIHSRIPISSGLSSSAALECAAATLIQELSGSELDPVRKALLCQRAENAFVGVSCGILDQYTSCAGSEGCALLLDCEDLSSRSVKLPFSLSVVICDTQCKRELAGSEYGDRRRQCEEGARLLGVRALCALSVEEYTTREPGLPSPVARRCRFIVEENERTIRMAEALTVADRAAIQQLTAASFKGACDLYEIGAPAMDAMMSAMLAAPGTVGARQAGAGFGGCMVAFVETSKTEAFAASVRAAYNSATGLQARVQVVQAAAGASVIMPAAPAFSQGGPPQGRGDLFQVDA